MFEWPSNVLSLFYTYVNNPQLKNYYLIFKIFKDILTDARLKDDGPATCPNCRCEISRQSCFRSLVAEKGTRPPPSLLLKYSFLIVLSQLPIECNHCKETFLRCDIETHEKYECNERPTKCIYNRIGCQWEGPFHELTNHVDNCFKITHPFKNSKDILESLKEKEISLENEKQSLLSVINVFSFEKVSFNGIYSYSLLKISYK